ncbi:hypothetical protein BDA96_03G266500 [Sorghum bicolor]|uniref:Uncharacterized protein n=1 Tax=Sorghum bicolor TaxID=4558 RepID=A0A921UNN4_SORBI|nr:hypothetical protein BDA96_03G266500 [Sorghum bicolor]
MEKWRWLERVIASAQPTDVGEQPDEFLPVRQIRTPPAAAAAAAAASAVISQLIGHAARVAAFVDAAACFLLFLDTTTRRLRNGGGGGEEDELLLAVAVAAADEAVADAAPAEDGARGAALPAPARGRGRRRLLPATAAGRPQAVGLRRHALQVLVPGPGVVVLLLLLVLPRPPRTRRSPVLLPRAELPLLQQEPAQRHPHGGRLRLRLLHLPTRRRGRWPAEDRVHGHDARVGGDRRGGEAELLVAVCFVLDDLGLHGWRQRLRLRKVLGGTLAGVLHDADDRLSPSRGFQDFFTSQTWFCGFFFCVLSGKWRRERRRALSRCGMMSPNPRRVRRGLAGG